MPADTDSHSKRRSKDMEWEVSTFLPAEMSRREQRFHEAASVNDADSVRKLLAEGVGINCRNSLDRTALHCTAACGHVAVTEALLENGADLEAKDKYGMRPVLWAAWFGHLDVCVSWSTLAPANTVPTRFVPPGPQTAPIALAL
ncbi:hypothetical protein C0Q70_00422 [Pomacea canaliculata]|uniref:Uncharacterized protein n=1 Tax=Pomacea canaliculata TaxID=400727 RepID=A0A2T7PWQ4_POMCA|nr:hypothetical protein C0Q70_00422 [Pomacea canaliculata]